LKGRKISYCLEDQVARQIYTAPSRDSPRQELRLGSLRVYFDLVIEPEPVVVVLAVGVKERNAVRMGKAVINL